MGPWVRFWDGLSPGGSRSYTSPTDGRNDGRTTPHRNIQHQGRRRLYRGVDPNGCGSRDSVRAVMQGEITMSYISEISTALTTVLTRASDSPPEKFAGYAANRDFWVAEASHCLKVIDGYETRFQRMKAASERSRPEKVDWPTVPISEPSMRDSDLVKFRRQICEVISRFLQRCRKDFPSEQASIYRDAKHLGVSIR